MPAKSKYEDVSALREKLSKCEAVFVAEYRGMTVAQSTTLRAKVRAAGGEMKVAKNTLMEIAMREEGMTAIPESMNTGPNVYTLAYGDPVAVAKVLKDAFREKANKAFSLKGGVLGSNVLSVANVEALADLPSRDVLIGQVVRTIAAPLTGLVTVLSGPIRNLANCVNQIKDKKEKAA